MADDHIHTKFRIRCVKRRSLLSRLVVVYRRTILSDLSVADHRPFRDQSAQKSGLAHPRAFSFRFRHPYLDLVRCIAPPAEPRRCLLLVYLLSYLVASRRPARRRRPGGILLFQTTKLAK